jgi:hypothetical protein
MAGEYTGVGLGSHVPDILPKLSQLLQIQAQQTELASARQSQQQRAALAKYDFGKHVGEDGTVDLNSLTTDPELRAAAGDQYLEVLSHAATAKQQQLQAKSQLFTLRGDQVAGLGQMITPLLGDPDVAQDNEKGRQKVNEAWMQYGQLYGDEALPVLRTFAAPLKNAPPGKMQQALRMIQMQAMDVEKQRQARLPDLVNKGGSLTNVNPDVATDAPKDIALTLPPGAQATTAVDQLGNPYVTYRDPRGNVTGTAPLGGGPGGPARFEVGEKQSFEAQAQKNFEAVTANRQAASMAPQQLDQIDKALVLSKQVSTGAWAAKRAEVESGLGSLIPGYQGVDDASKLQLLDKFAERIATDASKVLGVNATTDAQRESIHKQNANIGYTPKAVQDVLQYAKAQTMAMEAKGNAQERWLKEEGNGITKQHEFETKFRQAYDPVIFQLQAADADERKQIIESLDAKEAASLKEKRAKLRELGAF